MKGLSLKAFSAIERIIKDRFDRISMQFLGILPQKDKTKTITFNTTQDSLLSLFLKALGSEKPNKVEEQTLKTLTRVASGYLDALRDRSAARIMHDIDSHVTTQSLRKEPVSIKTIDQVINKEMDKAGKNLKMIVSAETNKAANTGLALQIAQKAEDVKDEDPTVFFHVTVDDVTGPEEFVLHLLLDRKTPRLWKLSEIGAEYHKVGDPNPKLPGLHPNCRCRLAYLPKDYGFDDRGHIKFIALGHDEFIHQREKHPKPR